ncbi:MAG: cation diffusion facilitator family transporter [Alphaproteobacteria bacterium]|nr:cation diffusion facilitator family transporter [Alphaproteobacteria bacterium]
MSSALSPAGRLDPRNAARITRSTALASVSTAGVLLAAKAWAWWISGSIAMLASLADSALDLAASLFTLWAVTEAATPPDAHHRYGHGKAEGFAALVQAVLVGASATLIAHEALGRFSAPKAVEHGGIAIGVMLLSIALTATLVVIQTRSLKKTGSVAIAGDRSHYAADFGANVAVLLGVAAAAWFGLPLADPVMGLAVALWLAWSAISVGRHAFDQLMDRELPDADRDRIRALAEGDGVSIHRLRTRAAGPIIHIQFHLDMPADLSLVEAHEKMVACEDRILAEFPGADILIHPDPQGFAEHHGADFFRGRPTAA